jgi:hypothetical protein
MLTPVQSYPRRANDNFIVGAIAFDLGLVGSTPVTRFVSLGIISLSVHHLTPEAYNDVYSIELGENLHSNRKKCCRITHNKHTHTHTHTHVYLLIARWGLTAAILAAPGRGCTRRPVRGAIYSCACPECICVFPAEPRRLLRLRRRVSGRRAILGVVCLPFSCI